MQLSGSFYTLIPIYETRNTTKRYKKAAAGREEPATKGSASKLRLYYICDPAIDSLVAKYVSYEVSMASKFFASTFAISSSRSFYALESSFDFATSRKQSILKTMQKEIACRDRLAIVQPEI